MGITPSTRAGTFYRSRPLSLGRVRIGALGFTLIEMLVVIAIIATLASILIFGLRYASAATKEKATRTTLEDLRGMLAELDANSNGHGVSDMEAAIYGSPAASVASPVGIVSDGSGAAGPRFTSAAVLKTQKVMQVLFNVASIRQHINQMPNNLKMYLSSAGPSSGVSPILLDAYGNPIIYVPSTGVSGVMVTGSVIGPLRSAHGAPSTVITQKSPDGHGFFTSAGPDEMFTGIVGKTYKKPPGDDNIYSFRN